MIKLVLALAFIWVTASLWATEAHSSIYNDANSATFAPRSLEMVTAHNTLRSGLGLSALEWDPELARSAQQWAEFLSVNGLFRHKSNAPYGENLFLIDGRFAKPGEVIDRWASEADDFDVLTNSCRRICGHYTQLVWANSKRVGCGVAVSGTRQIWVCNYDPPGNIVGHRPY